MQTKLFFSGLVLAFALIFTSCDKQDLTQTPVDAGEQVSELVQKLTENPDFISIIKIEKKISDDMMSYTENTKEESEIISYAENYDFGKEELKEYRMNLQNDFPELSTISTEELAKAIEIVFNNEFEMKNPAICLIGRDNCVEQVTLAYINVANITHAEHLLHHANCIVFYNDCID